MGNKNLLFESIFNRKFSDEDIPTFLAQITNDYPYFSPAQYFLLLQANKESTSYAQQVAKTAILFNNPHWLNFQLEEYKRTPAELSSSIVTDNEVVFAENASIISPVSEAHAKNTDEDEVPVVNSFVQETTLPEPEDFTVINKEAVLPIEPDSTTDAPFNIVAEESENDSKKIEEEQETEVTTMHIDDSPAIEENQSETSGAAVAEKESAPDIKAAAQSVHFNNDDHPLENEAETEEDISNDKEEIEPLNFRLNIDTSGIIEDTISFEPLHTTDYFASLGIKLGSEIQPSDKLGKQLKSFTEWLKTMKKIHSDQLVRQSDQADIMVQTLAENSNKQQEVVTESMADVLILQGKAKKAIEVYKKLSLLDSTKRAYFAAKIDQLKEH